MKKSIGSSKRKEAKIEKESSVDGVGRMGAMAGALAGASLLFISTILGQQPALDLPLRAALYCFAGALPIAVLALIVAYNKLDSAWFSVPFWISTLGVFAGVTIILWHVDVKATIIFGITCVISIVYFIAFQTFADP